MDIEYRDLENKTHVCRISGKPDLCPACGRKIDAVFYCAFGYGSLDHSRIEIVFRCPSKGCNHLFVAYYYVLGPPYDYFVMRSSMLPLIVEKRKFPDIIKDISKEFLTIFNQAMLAEKNGLDQVCGCGYRRALEFLIKDYLILLHPNEEDEIKKLWLGKTIERINNRNIKICAERAAWLGNDESHYVRVWQDKDIENLKDLIDLVVMWIDSEEKTKKYEKEMPKGN